MQNAKKPKADRKIKMYIRLFTVYTLYPSPEKTKLDSWWMKNLTTL